MLKPWEIQRIRTDRQEKEFREERLPLQPQLPMYDERQRPDRGDPEENRPQTVIVIDLN